jgi:hypothetical protein
VEAPGRWYEWGPDQHEYLEARGDRLVHVTAPRSVDRERLRAALQNARQVPADRLDEVVPEIPPYLRR